VIDPPDGMDAPEWEALALQAAGGDVAAWRTLFERLWDPVRAMVAANHSTGPMRASEDELREIVLRVVAKIGGTEGRGLQRFRAWRDRHPDKTFGDWMRIVTKNAVRDRVRARLGAREPGVNVGESVKRLLNEFASSPALESLGVRPQMTLAQTARELLEFARSRLPANGYRALTQWVEGATYEEIRDDLGIGDVDEARRLVRAAVAVIRRHAHHEGAEKP
jgi:DNA-directed RNA polymerase specialized sigma24 family protein